MRIIFLGTPQFAVPSLERLLEHPDFEVIGVVTQPDKRRGRGNQLIPSPVKKIALEHQLPLWQPERIKKAPETLTQLKSAAADVFAVVAYGQILSPELLAMPKLGCINVHGSILPKYRGAAPVQWSIYHGDSETGVTTMLIDRGMDSGPMLLKASTPIGLFDNAEQIAAQLAAQGADLLVETLLKWEKGAISAIPQNPDEATYAPLVQKSDYGINWSRSALEIHHQVRGFYPHCIATFRKQPLKIMATVPLNETSLVHFPPQLQKLQHYCTSLSGLTGHPGEVVSTIKNWGPVVQTGAGLLLLREIQLAGKRPYSGWDFVNGTHLLVGEILDT